MTSVTLVDIILINNIDNRKNKYDNTNEEKKIDLPQNLTKNLELI